LGFLSQATQVTEKTPYQKDEKGKLKSYRSLQAGRIAGVGRATVQRYLAAYREGGLDGLRHWGVVGPVSELAKHAETIKASLSQAPVRTIAEAAERIKELTGLSRGLTQTRVFLKELGFRWQRTRAVPVPPKSLLLNMLPCSASS
jgi:transposase